MLLFAAVASDNYLNSTVSDEILGEAAVVTLLFSGLNQYGYYYFLPEAVLEVEKMSDIEVVDA